MSQKVPVRQCWFKKGPSWWDSADSNKGVTETVLTWQKVPVRLCLHKERCQWDKKICWGHTASVTSNSPQEIWLTTKRLEFHIWCDWRSQRCCVRKGCLGQWCSLWTMMFASSAFLMKPAPTKANPGMRLCCQCCTHIFWILEHIFCEMTDVMTEALRKKRVERIALR